MRDFRIQLRAIILAITGFISVLLLIRIAFDLFDASDKNILVSVINGVTDIFVDPFDTIFFIGPDSEFVDLNIAAVTAFFVVILGGILISEIVTAFLYDSISLIIENVVDTCFKVVEGLIFLRIAFDLFLVNESSSFAKVIISLTNWTRGITDSALFDNRVYISTIIALIIVVIFDILTESFLRAIFDKTGLTENGKIVKKVTKTNRIAPQQRQVVPMFMPPQQPQHQPLHQTINVHIPPQQPLQPRQVVDPRGIPRYEMPGKQRDNG